MIYVLVLICSANLSPKECNVQTARAYSAYRTQPGVIVCPAPGPQMAADGAGVGEYQMTRCRVR